MSFLLFSAGAQAEAPLASPHSTAPAIQFAPVVDWVRVPFEPFVITSGSKAGTGPIDQHLTALQGMLEGYQHRQRVTNVARRNRLIQKGVLTCNAGMRKGSGVYSQGIVFSDVLQSAPGLALITRKNELELPQISTTQIDQQLQQQRIRLGLIQGRSYGPQLDAVIKNHQSKILWRSTAGHLSVPLINMMLAHRIDAMVDYPWKLLFDPALKPYLPYLQVTIISDSMPATAHVGCSDTPEGRALIEKINVLLQENKQQFQALYEKYRQALSMAMK